MTKHTMDGAQGGAQNSVPGRAPGGAAGASRNASLEMRSSRSGSASGAASGAAAGAAGGVLTSAPRNGLGRVPTAPSAGGNAASVSGLLGDAPSGGPAAQALATGVDVRLKTRHLELKKVPEQAVEGDDQVSPLIIIHNSLAENLRQRDGSVERTRTSTETEVRKRKRDRSSSSSQANRDIVLVDSKERLSEMATNIRGISNALSNVALTPMVKTVFIVTKIHDEELTPKTREIVEWLLDWTPHATDDEDAHAVENDLSIYVEDIVARQPEFALDALRSKYQHKADRLKLWRPETIAEYANKIDLVVTLGGDGTVLYTSWLFQKIVPPTLSFALGTLGFMTENQFEDFPEILDEHLTHGIRCALRMRFDCTIWRTKNPDQVGSEDLARELHAAGEACCFDSHYKDCEYSILNEVVVDRGPNPFVTMTELYGDYELLTCIRADGVVISTPTGSTAYSMSAGGSLVHPDIPAQLISPICPHTLSFRPLVVPDSMALHLGVPYDARSSAFASFDGKMRVELGRGDVLAISVSRYPFPKVLPQTSTPISWVQQLSRTLHWNEQKRPKRDV